MNQAVNQARPMDMLIVLLVNFVLILLLLLQNTDMHLPRRVK